MGYDSGFDDGYNGYQFFLSPGCQDGYDYQDGYQDGSLVVAGDARRAAAVAAADKTVECAKSTGDRTLIAAAVAARAHAEAYDGYTLNEYFPDGYYSVGVALNAGRGPSQRGWPDWAHTWASDIEYELAGPEWAYEWARELDREAARRVKMAAAGYQQTPHVFSQKARRCQHATTQSDCNECLRFALSADIRLRLERLETVNVFFHRCKLLRPLWLLLLRRFDFLQHVPGSTRFIRTAYQQAGAMITDLLAKKDVERGEARYTDLLARNLRAYRKRCERAALGQFVCIPSSLPLDVRSHIVGFLDTPAPLRNQSVRVSATPGNIFGDCTSLRQVRLLPDEPTGQRWVAATPPPSLP